MRTYVTTVLMTMLVHGGLAWRVMPRLRPSSAPFHILHRRRLSTETRRRKLPTFAAAGEIPAVESLAEANARTPTSEERQSVEERQLGHRAENFIGVPSTSKCRHGWPQAVLFRPVGTRRPVSGIMRLTCPFLVQAIDTFEAEGLSVPHVP